LRPERKMVSFRHLERMTDDSGMLEHSTGIIPNRREGYSADDNARALWACLAWLEHLDDRPEHEDAVRLLRRLAETYLAFLLWVQGEDGWLHNNMAYDRTPEPEAPSEDCQGRALWAAALAATQTRHPNLRLPAARLLSRGIDHAEKMTMPRGWAWSLAALSLLLKRDLSGADLPSASEVRRKAQNLAGQLETRLLDAYRSHAEPAWRWFEPEMTYGNGVLPWSLLQAYEATGNRQSLNAALEALEFLAERMTAPQGWIRPVGNLGWAAKGFQAQWDQQPLDVMKLALAAEAAHKAAGRGRYRELVAACREWFHGRNDKGVPMADPDEGACCDGLTPDGPNRNCGAESTLAYLLTELIYSRTYTNTEASSASDGKELIHVYRDAN